MGRVYPRVRKAPALRRCLGFGWAAATASSYRRCNTGEARGAGLLLLEYASRGRSWQKLLEVPYEPKGPIPTDTYQWLPHWSRRAPTIPPHRTRFPGQRHWQLH
jgi:hypothetical protein